MITVSEIMTTGVISLTPEDSVARAKQIMTEHGIRHIPLVDDKNRLLGVVSQRDLLRIGVSDCAEASGSFPRVDETQPLSKIMKSSVTVIDHNEALRAAGLELQRNKIGCLPVVKCGALVGIITDFDFVGVAINLIEQVENAEENFLE